MNPLYSVSAIREIEQKALADLPVGTLMQRAGKRAAEIGSRPFLHRDTRTSRFLILAGPGNNGGDALEMATILSLQKFRVEVLMIENSRKGRPAEASLALAKAIRSGIHLIDTTSFDEALAYIGCNRWDLIVDGLFGIGLSHPLSGDIYRLVHTVNWLDCEILALDVPSGLNADTGFVVGGNSGIAIRATKTVTFIGDKPGLHTGMGRDHAGDVFVETLDVSKRYFPNPCYWLNTPALFKDYLRPRQNNTHKGTYGSVAVIGGATGMAGAAILSARAALYMGTGRSYAVYVNDPPGYDPVMPELMFRPSHQFDFSGKTIVIGPGLGHSRPAIDILEKTIDSSQPAVFDADALNLIAASEALKARFAERGAPSVMTPHPLEAARLLGTDTAEIQSDRTTAARRLAEKFGCTALIKGSGTIIASPDGTTIVSEEGTPGLATAGSGDVLAGMIGSLIAQGFPCWEATLAGTWIHGHAAVAIMKDQQICIGLTASEIAPKAREVFNTLVYHAKKIL